MRSGRYIGLERPLQATWRLCQCSALPVIPSNTTVKNAGGSRIGRTAFRGAKWRRRWGFEPTERLPLNIVFNAAAFDHSAYSSRRWRAHIGRPAESESGKPGWEEEDLFSPGILSTLFHNNHSRTAIVAAIGAQSPGIGQSQRPDQHGRARREKRPRKERGQIMSGISRTFGAGLRLGLVLTTAIGLSACDTLGITPGDSAEATRAGDATPATQTVQLVERDIEAPEVFQTTDQGLWDGRPSLGGVWVAHPDVTEPERVIIRNEENGTFVIGALFRRERDNPGPLFQVSSDAAAALEMLAGAPSRLQVTALRREDTAAPAPEATTDFDTMAEDVDAPTQEPDAPVDIAATTLDGTPIEATATEATATEDGVDIAGATPLPEAQAAPRLQIPADLSEVIRSSADATPADADPIAIAAAAALDNAATADHVRTGPRARSPRRPAARPGQALSSQLWAFSRRKTTRPKNAEGMRAIGIVPTGAATGGPAHLLACHRRPASKSRPKEPTSSKM